jgi:hypothetical protein
MGIRACVLLRKKGDNRSFLFLSVKKKLNSEMMSKEAEHLQSQANCFGFDISGCSKKDLQQAK